MVSVIIPAYNEEKALPQTLRELFHQSGDYEVLVVDGHSKDRTRAIAIEHGARVIQDNGRGKGDALRMSFEAATTEIVVFIDADGSHDPDDIPKLVAPIRAGPSRL